jgi:hypothetical protein
MTREELWCKVLLVYLPKAGSYPIERADAALKEYDKRFTSQAPKIASYTNWDDVMDGVYFGDLHISVDLTPDNTWRVHFKKDDFSFPTYLPCIVDSSTAKTWWAENHKQFLDDAEMSMEAYNQVL